MLGIHESQEDADEIAVVEKNGIKIAMLAFTRKTSLRAPNLFVAIIAHTLPVLQEICRRSRALFSAQLF